MQFRYYQDEAIEHTFDYIRANPGAHPLIELPTGTGKSLVIAGFMERACTRWRDTRMMMLTHSKTLVEQNAAKLAGHWNGVDMGIYSAGLRKKQLGHQITFAGIDSVAEKPHVFGKQNVVMVDEAHMVDWKKNSRYHKFLSGLIEVNPKLRIVGLTATPWRMGLGHIATPQDGPRADQILFGGVSYSKIGVDDFHEFVQQGFLSPLYPLRTELKLDVSNVTTVGGEFNQGQLQKEVDKEFLTRAAIAESIELAGDRNHWIVFCAGQDHVDHTVQYLREAGISAVGVHSGQTDKMNDDNVKMCLRGEVRALVNMGVLTTGFDWPELNYIMMLRPTKSPMLWVQMLGRGTRPAPWSGKTDCLVGDFAGNSKRLGPINDPLIPRAKGKGGGLAPVKTCSSEWDHSSGTPVQTRIGCQCENHASAAVCQKCGVPFPPPKPKMAQYADTTKLMRDVDDGNPVIEILKVTSVSYQLHKKFGKPDSVKVTYACDYRMFNEFVMLEHDGYALRRSRNWWANRMAGDIPVTTSDALDIIHLATVPNHIRVHTNLKYPDIKDHCFDGTGFGTVDPMEMGDAPTVIQKPRISLGADPWALRPEGIITADEYASANAAPLPQPYVHQPSDSVVFDDDDIPF